MINGWWSEDGEWFCIRAGGGTISLRMEAAREALNKLAAAFNEKIIAMEPVEAPAHKPPYEIPTVFR